MWIYPVSTQAPHTRAQAAEHTLALATGMPKIGCGKRRREENTQGVFKRLRYVDRLRELARVTNGLADGRQLTFQRIKFQLCPGLCTMDTVAPPLQDQPVPLTVDTNLVVAPVRVPRAPAAPQRDHGHGGTFGRRHDEADHEAPAVKRPPQELPPRPGLVLVPRGHKGRVGPRLAAAAAARRTFDRGPGGEREPREDLFGPVMGHILSP